MNLPARIKDTIVFLASTVMVAASTLLYTIVIVILGSDVSEKRPHSTPVNDQTHQLQAHFGVAVDVAAFLQLIHADVGFGSPRNHHHIIH